MQNRMQYVILAGFAVILAVLVFSPKYAISGPDDSGAGGNFIMQTICDGTANNKPYVFVLDTENKRLLLYDIVATKLRFCSARYIQYDRVIKEWELADKPNGSVKDIKAAVEEEAKRESERTRTSNGKSGK